MDKDLNYELIVIIAGSFTCLTGALGMIVGALCWFLRHLVIKTIPDMQKSFGEHLAAERDSSWEMHRLVLARIDRAEANILGNSTVVPGVEPGPPDLRFGRTANGGGS